MDANRVRLYEQSPLLDVAGDTIRPGGLALTDRALAYCALRSGARVLDVGCGQGASVAHLIAAHGLSAVGVDPSAVLLANGRMRNPTLALIQARGEHLPFAAGSLDAVLTECVLSLVSHPAAGLSEFRRVLRPDGYLMITDIYSQQPDDSGALNELPLESCLVGARSQAEITEQVAAQGFTIRLWEDHTQALHVFAARLIWAHGSLAQFWRCATGASADKIQGAVARSKPGYYLLIAQKT